MLGWVLRLWRKRPAGLSAGEHVQGRALLLLEAERSREVLHQRKSCLFLTSK